MTCSCGAQMWYLCKEKVIDYSHFYGQVGTRETTSLHVYCFSQGGAATATKKCLLWSDNKALHQAEVARAAEEARKMLAKENVKLDIDPLHGIADFENFLIFCCCCLESSSGRSKK